MAGEEVVDAVQHELADGLEAGGVGGGEQGRVRVKGVLGQRDSQTGLLSWWVEGVVLGRLQERSGQGIGRLSGQVNEADERRYSKVETDGFKEAKHVL